MADDDVPSPIDFHDLAQAKAWERDTVARRPWRPEFFAAFIAELNRCFAEPFVVLELGSGPGHLAERILLGCAVRRYAALDFSDAMHRLARARLAHHLDRIEFVSRDFRLPHWHERLGEFDAVVTLQAAHELRHKTRLAGLLAQTRTLLTPGGVFLYCDHYAEPSRDKHPNLYLEREDQPRALERAGFIDVRKLLEKGGMALFAASVR
jgi:SAM-dependent methyltransferase